MRFAISVCFTATLVALWASSSAQATPPLYHLTDLGTLGGSQSNAGNINASGQVVGDSYLGNGAEHAFIYSGGVMTDLGTLGGTVSGAPGINASGQVVGSANTKDDLATYAYLYSGGTMTSLGTLGGAFSQAFGINASGQVVGDSSIGGPAHAFLYSAGVMTDLGTLGGNSSYAYGINDSGQIVGQGYTSAFVYHAYIYSSGTMNDLGTLGGTYSIAFGVNSTGQVVGNSTTTGDIASHAFFDSDGMMTDLGTLGGKISEADGINSLGQVVGFADTPVRRDAFLYSDDTMYDLNNLLDSSGSGWNLTWGHGINDSGWIVADAVFGGNTHAVLLTPIPEPSSLALGVMGVIMLGLTLHRKFSGTVARLRTE